MFNTYLEFLMTVPIQNSVLRAIIMVSEMFVMGFILYHLWEIVPRLPRAGKLAITFLPALILTVISPIANYSKMRSKRRAEVADMAAPDKEDRDESKLEQFNDLFTDLVP